MRNKTCLIIALLLLIISSSVNAQLFEGFNQSWESNWKQHSFTLNENVYETEKEKENNVLKVESDDSATAMWKNIELDVNKNTNLLWYWKTNSFLKNIDEKTKSGDDYVGRVYVIFGATSFYDPNLKAICYVWASDISKNKNYNSPYSSNVKIKVLQNNNSELNEWYKQSRNLYADYKDLFGGNPKKISAIAFMVDTDNSNGKCTTWFDYIKLD